MNQVAGKAQAYSEALEDSFKVYAQNVLEMARYMCEIFMENGIKLTTSGTDCHIILIHTGDKSGREVADTLESDYDIVVNKNSVPNDSRNFIDTSGIRIGTAAMVTKKGNDKEYFREIALNIIKVIKS